MPKPQQFPILGEEITVERNAHGITALRPSRHPQDDLPSQSHRDQGPPQVTEQSTHFLEMLGIDALNANGAPASRHAAIPQRFQLRFDLGVFPVKGKHQAS